MMAQVFAKQFVRQTSTRHHLGVCACNDASMVLDAVRGCVPITSVCPGNKVDDDGNSTTPCICPAGTVEKANNICCGSDCTLLNNECVTACPAGQSDPLNSCNTQQCQATCDETISTWNTATRRCDCKGDLTEVPPGSEVCECPYPANNDPSDVTKCTCPTGMTYNTTRKECVCEDANQITNQYNLGVCISCPSGAQAVAGITCQCSGTAQYDPTNNTCN